MFKQTQRSFAGGWLDRELMGRTDLAKYYTGASRIENFLVRRQGNLVKRRGTDFAADLSGILGRRDGVVRPLGKLRLLPISQEREKGYYVLLADRRAFILDTERGIYCTDGAWRREATQYDAPVEGGATEITEDYVMEAPFVARIGSTFYDTLAAAVAAHVEGDTIVMGEDAELADDIALKGTLDMNGHVLTVTGNYSITFETDTDAASCGITSRAAGARIAFSDTLATSASNQLIVHRRGHLTLRDFSCDDPFTGYQSCFLYSDSSDNVYMFRLKLSGRGGLGLVHLYNDVENQTEGPSTSRPYGGWPAGVEIEGCELEWEYGNSYYTAISHGGVSNDSRKVSFFSGSLRCPGLDAAKVGLFVYGGMLYCRAIGTNTSYSAATSRVKSGLMSFEAGSDYLWGDGTYSSVERVDGDGNPVLELVGDVDYFSYAPEYSTPYTSADNRWPEADFPAPSGGEVPADESGASLTTGTAPYCVATPYSDAELDELDAFQSGDTVFLAHAQHAPARIVFDASGPTLAFSRLKFNASSLKRPVIVSVVDSIHSPTTESSLQGTTTYKTVTTYQTTASACNKTTAVYKETSGSSTLASSSVSNLPLKTVHYCVTAVKDGVEGPPSNPVAVTYGAPWAEGGTVTLKIEKGANEEEPDWYNVYKKESTEYGLIGSTGRPVSTGRRPSSVVGYEVAPNDSAKTYLPGLSATLRFNGSTLLSTERADALGRVPASIAAESEVAVEGALGRYQARPGAGGMLFGGPVAIFDYGLESGVRADTVHLAFDVHTFDYTENAGAGVVALQDIMMLAGKTVKVTVQYQNAEGEARSRRSVSKTVTLPAVEAMGASYYSGEHVKRLGTFVPGGDLPDGVSAEPRTATFFFDELSGGDMQVTAVTVECKDENGAPCQCAICGYSLSLSARGDGTFVDDYITPDMSLTPPADEDSFARSGDFPSCVGIYQQRLVFAASANRPSAFWMSAVGDLYTFAAHSSIREDDALSAELAATEFPRINHLVFSRDVIMLSDSGEWRIAPVSGNALSYKTLSATLQSSIGSAKWLKPITVGNEVVFAEKTGMALRSVAYNFASDGYESQDLTVLSENIFASRPIVRMCFRQHPDSTIVCALSDGTLATLVYMREHEVVAWSHHTLGGGWHARDVATSKALNGGTTDVALVVARDGRVQLWAVRPDDPSPTVAAQVCLDGCHTMTGAEASAQGAWLEGFVAVDLLSGAVAKEAAGLVAERSYAVGWPIRSELVTVRPEPSPQDTIQFETKNLKNVEVRSIAAGKYAVRSFAAAPGVRATAVTVHVPVSGGAVELACADVATTVMGSNTGDGRVQLVHEDIWPMSILQLSANYEIQPLSGSEG